MSALSITMRSVMQEITEAVEALNACLEYQAESFESWGFDCATWADFASKHADALAREAAWEMKAELAVPQHLIW